jgi:hypothetical protein
MRGVVRLIFALHRYIGIGIGLLMLIWCLSGVVMMYMPYPSLAEGARLSGLQRLDPGKFTADPGLASFYSLEIMHDRLLLQTGRGLVDLETGKPFSGATPADTMAVAQDFARGNGIRAGTLSVESITGDQWTVGLRRDLPLYRVRLNDAADTFVYISGRSGKAVQMVTSAQRFWNYLGAVPHWIYFTGLRAQPALWSQVVIWTSLTGSFLTLTGLYIGIRQWWRARRAKRWSPYKGFAWWHHIPGLVFGIFLMTWVASGLLSMNPWGLLEGGGDGGKAAVLTGNAPPPSREGLSAALSSGAVLLEAAPLNGKLFFIATRNDGSRTRLDANGMPAPMSAAERQFITAAILGNSKTTPQLLFEGDDYYFSHGGDRAKLPTLRFVNSNGDRFYVDPLSGGLVATFDSSARGYRWLFQGFHRLDFNAALRARPFWDILMLILLTGATLVAGTGVWMGWRYLKRSVFR